MEEFCKRKQKELSESFKDVRQDIKFQFPVFDLKEISEDKTGKKVFKIVGVE